jgi:hypothetical protein
VVEDTEDCGSGEFVCDECIAIETGKDCEKRGEEAGRLDGRYEVSKVVPPSVVLGGEYTEVLWPGNPKENESAVGVGNDETPNDVTLAVE